MVIRSGGQHPKAMHYENVRTDRRGRQYKSCPSSCGRKLKWSLALKYDVLARLQVNWLRSFVACERAINDDLFCLEKFRSIIYRAFIAYWLSVGGAEPACP